MIALFAAAPVHAQTWRIQPSMAVESTFTNNVDLSRGEDRKSDWVNELTPGVRFTESGAHSRLTGLISVPILLYTRTASENNYVAPQVNIDGSFEAIEHLLFIDASANVSQNYVTPFAAHPSDLVTATNNRYTSQSYRVSPYIKGFAPDDIDYELRQSSLWTDANATGTIGGRAYTNEVSGHLAQKRRPFGWSAEIDRTDIDFSATDDSESTEIGRLRGIYQFDPTFGLYATAGYEYNEFFRTHTEGAVYGLGFTWHPSERTRLNAAWEHRFFGSSYHVEADHRTPLTVWTFRAFRDISSYPQQLGQLPAGANVFGLLNGLFVGRFPDPAQRQSFVEELIRERGLPATLTTPVPLLAEQLTLLESLTGTVGLLGARNSVFVTAYRTRDRPVQPSDTLGVVPAFVDLRDTTQLGTNAVWNHRLHSNLTMSSSIEWLRATSDNPTSVRNTQYALRMVLSRNLSPLTTAHVGARYQDFHTDVSGSFSEVAVFVGLHHDFR